MPGGEVMTILVLFQPGYHAELEAFHFNHVKRERVPGFPGTPGYTRRVGL